MNKQLLFAIGWSCPLLWLLLACGTSTKTSTTDPTGTSTTSAVSPSTESDATTAGPPGSPAATSTAVTPKPPNNPTPTTPAVPPATPPASDSADVTSNLPANSSESDPGATRPPTDGCVVEAWPSADPTLAGPYATVTETNVGPAVGQGEEGGLVAFTVFRPEDLGADGRCHPVVTWGNGTGANPNLYKVLLSHLASHGFVVVASDSPNVAQGDPPPMVAGVTWLIAENDDPQSIYYHHIDTTHVGATGHSQGGFATTTAGGDSQVTTIAPLCGASQQRNLHGPALLLCGGADDVVPCDRIVGAFDSITSQPAMFANYVTADHANWVTFRGTSPSPMEATVTAWMRVQLMGDTDLRTWFYGSSCKLCTDEAWEVSQKMMD